MSFGSGLALYDTKGYSYMSGKSGWPLHSLMESLGHTFSSTELLEKALTHPSIQENFSRQKKQANAYERLEFLGDRVLGLVMAEWLLERFPDEREGDIAKRYAALVRRESLQQIAAGLDLACYVRVTSGKKDTAQANRSVLSDACEAVIGALYLDGGLDVARRFIRRVWEPLLAGAVEPPMDPKTQLQEWLLARGRPLPIYETIETSGPSHAPSFKIRARVEEGAEATGIGSSKREAEKIAATLLLKYLQEDAGTAVDG